MNSRAVVIETASPELADEMKDILTRQMANKLAAECVDLSGDAAVIRVLSSTFGAQSVAALWDAARDLARQAPPSGTRH